MQGKMYSLWSEWTGAALRWYWDAIADDEMQGSGIEDSRADAIRAIASALQLTADEVECMSYRCANPMEV